MRTTLTLDDDVAALLTQMQESRRIGLKEAVHVVMRAGLAALESPRKESRRSFRTPEVSVGRLLIPIDSISEALAVAEGEDYR